MHEKSHHNNFPIASQTLYTKNLITINSQSLPRRKCMITITSQLLPRLYTRKISSQLIPNRFPDENARKISSQSLPNRFQTKIHKKFHHNCFPIASQTKMHERSYHQLLFRLYTRKFSSQLIPNC